MDKWTHDSFEDVYAVLTDMHKRLEKIEDKLGIKKEEIVKEK